MAAGKLRLYSYGRSGEGTDGPDDPLAEKDSITAKELAQAPLILPRRTRVESGLAYSIVVEGAIHFWDQAKITYRPLMPSLTATSVLAWKRGQPFSLAATKFIEFSKCFLGTGKA